MTTEAGTRTTAAKRRKRTAGKSKKAHKGAQTGTRSSRDLSASDWLLLRYLVLQDKLSFSAAGRRMNVNPSAIRMRCKREKWQVQLKSTPLPSLDDVIVQRNDHQMLRALTVMDGALEAAMRENDPAVLAVTLQKSELIGKHVRGAQNIARASHMSTVTKGKLKANGPSTQQQIFQDREAIKRELDNLAAKLPALLRLPETPNDPKTEA